MTAVLRPETFRFFRDLARNNRKPWMDAHRDRYQEHVVAPLRALVEALAPAAISLHGGFETSGRVGANLSRINRDTRFARDKTPYHTGMYVYFTRPELKGDDGQLYVGIAATGATMGFRIYGGGRDSTLRRFARLRGPRSGAWLARESRRFARRYDSYWYATEKGRWTRHSGFPRPEDWHAVRGLVVRRRVSRVDAVKPGFLGAVVRAFEDLMPLYRLTAFPERSPQGGTGGV